MPLALNPLDANSLVNTFGALGVFVILFAETGLLIGFFLPGDSLLIAAGLAAAATARSSVHLSLSLVLIAAALGTLLGSQTGYLLGRRTGPVLLARYRWRRLHDGVARASELLARYGHGRALVLTRLVPVVRTVINPLAGILRVPMGVFTTWNVVGGLIWSVGLILAGYEAGSHIKHVDRYVIPIALVVILLSLIPLGLEVRRGGFRGGPGDPAAVPPAATDHQIR